jgi:hypothetical protein
MRSPRRPRPALLAALLLAACTKDEPRPASLPRSASASSSVHAAAGGAGGVVELRGLCDASAAVAADAGVFVVANDEDNVLRVFRPAASREPWSTFDLGPFLGVTERHPEADIEGAARVGELAYWITSHGANKDGKARPNRRRLFATELAASGDGVTITPVGRPYTGLVDDLARAPELASYALGRAAELAPKEAGALNIEGLAWAPEGALLLGLRSPVPGGKALVVPLENPREVVSGEARARLGKPILLALGGLGIRSLEYVEAERVYFLVAGPAGEEGSFAMYRWSGAAGDAPARLDGAPLGDLRPEGLLIGADDGGQVRILSDDGTRSVGGVDCKDAPEARRSFRTVVWRP